MIAIFSFDPTIALKVWADYTDYIDDHTTISQCFFYIVDEEKEELCAVCWGVPCGEDFICHVIYISGGHEKVADCFFDSVKENLGCKRLVGYLPENNKLVRVAAVWVGFKQVECEQDVYFLKHGEQIKCDKYVRE